MLEEYVEGVKARHNGKQDPIDNPYELNTKEYFAWSNGWQAYNSYLKFCK